MPETAWTDMVYDWLTEKGEDLSDVVGDAQKAFTQWEIDQMAKGVDLLGGPESETFETVTEAMEDVGGAMEGVLGASGGGQPAMGLLKAKALIDPKLKYPVHTAVKALTKKMSKAKPMGREVRRGTAAGLLEKGTKIVEDPNLIPKGSLGQYKGTRIGNRVVPGSEKIGISPEGGLSTHFHEWAGGHMPFGRLSPESKAAFMKGIDDGKLLIPSDMLKKMRQGGYKNLDHLTEEVWTHNMAKYAKGSFNVNDPKERMALEWMDEMMGMPSSAVAQKLQIVKPDKDFFVK